MTRSTPDYDARDFDPVEDVKIRLPRITGRSIIAAVGEILAEQRKRIDGLEAEIKALHSRLEQVEPKPAPRLVPDKGSMIA